MDGDLEEEPVETAITINDTTEDRQPLISKKEPVPEAEAASLKGRTFR